LTQFEHTDPGQALGVFGVLLTALTIVLAVVIRRGGRDRGRGAAR
jgi:hypothetical protein